MAEDFFQGYWGASLEVLKKYNCRVWSQAECQTTGGLFKGTILPRAAFQDDQHIVMKVNTGYNIGVDISTITSMVETDYKKANYHIPEKEFPYTEGLPHVVVGFLVVGLHHAGDGTNIDTDVVARVDLHDDVLVVLEGGAGQDGAFEEAAGGLAFGLAPHAAVIFFEHLKSGAPISLEKIFSHDVLI